MRRGPCTFETFQTGASVERPMTYGKKFGLFFLASASMALATASQSLSQDFHDGEIVQLKDWRAGIIVSASCGKEACSYEVLVEGVRGAPGGPDPHVMTLTDEELRHVPDEP